MAGVVRIVEVGPRDGLQNESTQLSLDDRQRFVQKLAAAGLTHIEVGAFVSPKWVPQMQESGTLIRRLFEQQAKGLIDSKVNFSALVPNPKGMEGALDTPLKEVAIFGACSEGFSKRNINCTIDESFARFAEVMSAAKARKIKVRGYLSTAFGCPYDGYVNPSHVAKLVQKMLKLGVYEVSIGDTIGVATPKQVRGLLGGLEGKLPFKKLAMHFHDTRGTALANVLASWEMGIRTFDSSVGGLGGCPYASGASGNLATEDLVYMMHGMGIKTGVELESLIAIRPWLEKRVGHRMPSHVGHAGLPLAGTIK
ncbi:MAG: hydroxymethylglutaryl-CoA lyase [Bdellovibrionaceae bacterium]|nr:hydroxymethylglutaryl-CoA lyase [Bdellovibrionales bacterium]MCB9086278.1 hydroxymethylglutaryl-CoA lyase [Pseudobdellovibrionaceae bacterium]